MEIIKNSYLIIHTFIRIKLNIKIEHQNWTQILKTDKADFFLSFYFKSKETKKLLNNRSHNIINKTKSRSKLKVAK